MTRRHLLLLSLLMILIAWRAEAQFTPQGFNYQCIVRDGTGASMNNQTVTLLFTVRSGTSNGPVNYSEKQTVSTNEFGLVNLVIGQGSPLQGTFPAVNWGSGAKFLTVSVETAPNVFDELGSTQLMSVPYAIYAQNSANGQDNWGTQVVQTDPALKGDGTAANPLGIAQQGAQTGQVLKWDGAKWAPQNDISDTVQTGGTLTQINTGTGLTGGPITTSGTISLDNTAVAPGVYGGSAQIPVITVDQTGRITDVFTVMPQPTTIGITGAAGINVQQNGVNFTITNTGDTNANDDLTTGTVAAGDVSGPFSNLQINPDAVGSAEIAGGAVGATELANNAVGTTKIADDAVTAAKLNDMGAASGQVLKWTGTAWAPAVDNTGTINLTGGTGINVTGSAPNFTIVNTGDTNAADDITTFTQANGDVTGPFADLQLKPNVVGANELSANAVTTPKIGDGAVTGNKIAQQSASNGQVLKWNGTTWAPANDNTGTTTISPGVGIDVIPVPGGYVIGNNGDVNPFDDITENSTAGGDLSGPFSNLQIKQNIITNFEMANNSISTNNLQNAAVTGVKIAQMSALNNQVLKWNGATWAPATDDTGGDNWGAQSVVANPTLSGVGTVGNPLAIAQQGASNGQVLKWTGTTWTPAADNNTGPDNWGTQTALAGTTLTGTGIVGNPLNIAQQGATPGQVLKWNGTTWVPAADNNTGGDNWGTQTVVADSEFAGNGTAASPLELAPQGAAVGQVLKWNGTTWAPQNDDNTGPDNWGTQTAITNPTIDGNGTVGDPLRIASQGATNGQVLKWNGVLWAPFDEAGGDDWGTQTALAGTTLTGTGIVGSPLDIAQQGATPGQVLKWNGTTWAPQNDNNAGPDNWGTQTALAGTTLTGTGIVGSPLNIAQQGATPGQVLKWDGATWAPADDSGTGVGDNWGTQTVVTNVDFLGDGTVGAPLRLAGQGATFGQVLKWQGTFWAPEDEYGDNWGVQSVESSNEFIGNGTVISPLALAPQGAAAGQVLKWTGTTWAPSDDLLGGSGGNNYAAGTGISITGVIPNLTINNTGDLSNTNELQNLSLAGNNLSLSNGGGTVTLPIPVVNNYSAGAGINIAGSAPNFTIINTGDADSNPANELQNLSLNGTLLKITGTNSEVSLDTLLNSVSSGFWSANGSNINNTNSGNVGIGTTVPISTLHVKGNGEVIRVEGTNSAQIGFAGGGGAVNAILNKTSNYFTLATNDSSSIVLATANSKSLFVDGISGNVGIGAANTGAAKLAVYHDLNGGFLLQNPDGNNWEFQVAPLSGNLQLYNSTLGGIPAGIFATNGVYTPSDRRLKKDISNLPGVLDKIRRLNAVSYHYLPEKAGSQRSIGFLAQDVQTYFPELVTENTARDGNSYLGLNYAGFGVLAVKAVQEQQDQIESLKQENEDLRKRLNTLELRINQVLGSAKK